MKTSVLKKDKKLIEKLKEQKKQAFKEAALSKLYELMDMFLALEEQEEAQEIADEIVKIAFEKVGKFIEEGCKLDFEKEEDFSLARALYENALHRWEGGDFKNAKELFLTLFLLSREEKRKKSFLLCAIATKKRAKLSEFSKEFFSDDSIGEKGVFLEKLNKKALDFYKENFSLLKEELEKYSKLL